MKDLGEELKMRKTAMKVSYVETKTLEIKKTNTLYFFPPLA